MIFSVGGTTMSVVYFTLARMATMSWEWYDTVRAEASAATDAAVGAVACAANVSGRELQRARVAAAENRIGDLL
jgi:hypothetical protein